MSCCCFCSSDCDARASEEGSRSSAATSSNPSSNTSWNTNWKQRACLLALAALTLVAAPGWAVDTDSDGLDDSLEFGGGGFAPHAFTTLYVTDLVAGDLDGDLDIDLASWSLDSQSFLNLF